MKGVISCSWKTIRAEMASERLSPGSVIPPLVELVTASPLLQCQVTVRVAPLTAEPAGSPLLELSRATWLAIVLSADTPLPGMVVVSVAGELPLAAQARFPVV